MRQLTCILIAVAVVGVYGDEPEKLVNGVPTSIQENPHAVSIRTGGSHMCGGSIIGSRYILTAGHCIAPLLSDARLRRTLTVVSGTGRLSSGGNVHKVSEMSYYETYNPNAGRAVDDIGIMKLSEPIKFDQNQQPAKLPTQDVDKNQSVQIVAWGSKGLRQGIHDDLRKLDGKVMLSKECQSYHRFMTIGPKEFCIPSPVGSGACHGDSGSGVMRLSDGAILGVVSGGIPCARGIPDVFTSVYSYLPWIKQKMEK